MSLPAFPSPDLVPRAYSSRGQGPSLLPRGMEQRGWKRGIKGQMTRRARAGEPLWLHAVAKEGKKVNSFPSYTEFELVKNWLSQIQTDFLVFHTHSLFILVHQVIR